MSTRTRQGTRIVALAAAFIMIFSLFAGMNLTVNAAQALDGNIAAAPGNNTAVAPGTEVQLSYEGTEAGVALTYTLYQFAGDEGGTEAVVGEADTLYTGGIALPEGGFPYKLVARASLEGHDDLLAGFLYTEVQAEATVEVAQASEPAEPAAEELEIEPAEDERVDIALFNYAAAQTGTPFLPTGGDNAANSKLEFYVGSTARESTGYTSGGIAMGNGFDDDTLAGSEVYWLLSTSSTGLSNIEFTFMARSSGTGPRDWKVQYSTNKSTWVDVNVMGKTDATTWAAPAATAALVAGTIGYPSDGYLREFKADLSASQSAISDKGTLYFRVLKASGTSVNDSTIATTGTHTGNNFEVTGEYLEVADQVVAPETTWGSAVPIGAEVVFTSETEGATIEASTTSTTEGFTALTDGKYTIAEADFGRPLHVKATKDGMEDSRVRTFNFTHAKLSAVRATPGVGTVLPGTAITLTPAAGDPEDATITYTLYKKAGTAGETAVATNATYTAPIALNGEQDDFPFKIVASAGKTGYLSSVEASFTYSYEKPAGGEQNYFGQLHAHTTLSDGAGTVEEAFEYGHLTAGLDFLAVTDHSNSYDKKPSSDKATDYNLVDYNADNESWMRGRAAAAAQTAYAAENTGGDFLGFFGYEMTWSGGPGHINTFNTTGVVSRNNTILNGKTNDSGMKAYYALLKNTPGSISQFNHPGTTFGNFSNYAYWDANIDERITLLEVGNGEGTIGSGGYFPSYEEYNLALDKGWHVAPTNNQDNHKKGWGTSNPHRSVAYTNDYTIDGIYNAMRNMRMYATETSDLDILFSATADGVEYPLGSILDEVPGEVTFNATVTNGTPANRVTSISLITTGGVEVYKQTYDNAASATFWTKRTNPAPGWYYLWVNNNVGGQNRVAVTAPIWLGAADKIGITSFSKDTDLPVTSEELAFATSFFNSETAAATVTDIAYTVENSAGTSAIPLNGDEKDPPLILPAGGSANHSVNWTPTVPGENTVKVTATVEFGGEAKTYSSSMTFTVADINEVLFLGVDGAHRNEYVAGNYKDNMGNFAAVGASYDVRVNTLSTSEALIDALGNEKYKAFIFTAPSRRLLPYTDSAVYSQAELDAIVAFAQRGGMIILANWSDNYEKDPGFKELGISHMAEEQNRILEALGASLRMSDDASVYVKNEYYNGSDSNLARLYLGGANAYNFDNPFNAGVDPEQVYSAYGGSTIYAVDAQTKAPVTTLPASVSAILYGVDEVYYPGSTVTSDDKDGDGYGLGGTTKPPVYADASGADRVLLNASETLDFGGGKTAQIIVAGAAFMSNYEIRSDPDNVDSLPYTNYTIAQNIFEAISPNDWNPITIEQAKTKTNGEEFTIDAIATSGVNTQNVDAATNKGFFDTIYAQDETGGINLFPVSRNVEEGQKIRVHGTISEYQGEMQVAVDSYRVLDRSINSIEPADLSTAATMNPDNRGLLVRTKGTVVAGSIIKEADGTINQFKVDDGSGEALVYLNGYITPGVDLSGIVIEGKKVEVAGLASYGENYNVDGQMAARIRVRDRAEITLVDGPGPGITKITLDKTNATVKVGATADVAAITTEPATLEVAAKLIDSTAITATAENGTLSVSVPADAAAGTYRVRVYAVESPSVFAELRLDVIAGSEITDPDVELEKRTIATPTVTVYSKSTSLPEIALSRNIAGGGAAWDLMDPLISFHLVQDKSAADFTEVTKALKAELKKVDGATLQLQEESATALASLKSGKKVAIEMRVGADPANPVKTMTLGTLTIKTNHNLPTVKAATVKLNTYFSDETAKIIFTGATVDTVTVTSKPEWLNVDDINNGFIVKANQNTKANGTLRLKASLVGWNGEVDIKVSVKAAVTKPSVKLAKSTVTVYKDGASSVGVPVTLVPKSKSASLAGIRVTGLEICDPALLTGKNDKKTYALNFLEEPLYKLEEDGSGTPGAYVLNVAQGRTPDDGKLMLVATVDNGTPIKLPLTVKLYTKALTIKPAKSTITLNPFIGESYDMAILPSAADFDMSLGALSVTPSDPNLTWAPKGDNEITFTINSAAPKNANYKADVKLTVGTGDNATEYTTKVTVKTPKTLAAPALTYSVKGSLDLTKGTDAYVTLTTKFTNYNGGFTTDPTFVLKDPSGKVVEDALDAEQLAPNTWRVSWTGEDLSIGNKYKIELAKDSGKVMDGAACDYTKAKAATVKVTATKPKLTYGPTAVTMYKADTGASATVFVFTQGDVADIREIKLKDQDKKNKSGKYVTGFIAEDLKDGTVVIRFDTRPEVDGKAIKSKNLILEVYLEGNVGKPAATAKVKVTVK